MDWSIISQELFEHPDFELKVPKVPLKKIWDTGHYRLMYHTVADDGLSPKEAMFEAVRLLILQTQCEATPDEQPPFMKDQALDGVFVYAYPKPRRNLLNRVPSVHFALGRQNGIWTCDAESVYKSVEKLDWKKMKDWESMYK